LDSIDKPDIYDNCIYIDFIIQFSRFASLRGRYEDYIEWLNDLIIYFKEWGWEYFLDSKMREKIILSTV